MRLTLDELEQEFLELSTDLRDQLVLRFSGEMINQVTMNRIVAFVQNCLDPILANRYDWTSAKATCDLSNNSFTTINENRVEVLLRVGVVPKDCSDCVLMSIIAIS